MDKQNGWCGTCNPEAYEGERGYCPADQASLADDINDENTIVYTSKKWGFCSEECSTNNDFAKNLQETKITILNNNDCKLFSNGDLGLEFRAGRLQYVIKL